MSWVIVNKETGEGVMETYSEGLVRAINTKKYKAVPIREYLYSLNEKVRADAARAAAA